MHFRYLIFILFALSARSLSAQFNFGVEGGVNSSTIHYRNLPSNSNIDPNPRLHYFAGARATYAFSGKWSAGLGAQYALRGVGYDANSPSETREFRRNCIDLTPQVSWQALKWLELNLGVYQTFTRKTEIRLFDSDDWLVPFFQYYDKTDFGIAPGIRFKYGHFYLSVSGQIGLQTIAALGYYDDSGVYREDIYEKNRALQLGVGYDFFRN